ncbi:FecR family protein [Mangrovibacterium lignilyticum]|uniref:FecR family protein n=1 Tax=Mangrovibacterium lignilyticum TaxID=2668052 RepID=UPI0013D04668|nr:FecR domain-containing protein [Mangrovibacterium lignilyticum]
MTPDQQIIDLISGNLNAKQKDEILKVISQDPALQEEYEKIKNAWALSSSPTFTDIKKRDESFQKLVAIIHKRKRIKLIQTLKYAAILILFFALGYVASQQLESLMLTESYKTNELTEIYVPKGEQAEITLADNTKVILNSDTKLTFPVKFNKKQRFVSISGEAYFDVSKSKIPFIVNSSYGNIRVLGTSFNIRAYGDMEYQTTLVEGKVIFTNKALETILKPGEQLTVTTKNQANVKKVNTTAASSWTLGVISFENEPLMDVVKKLERHFNITISLDKTLAPIRFTGKVVDESIDEVMLLIDKTKPIKYTYDKNKKNLTIMNHT